jgi:hypothetical protein
MGSAEMKVICVQMNEATFGALAPIAVCLETLALRHFELWEGCRLFLAERLSVFNLN